MGPSDALRPEAKKIISIFCTDYSSSVVVAKFETIEIGPGKTPSTQTNETIRKALENGIAEGEKLINARVRELGADVNGWGITGLVVNGSNTRLSLEIMAQTILCMQH